MPLKEEKIKVCLVSISLGKGGLERSCAVHSEMLSSLGYDVHIVILTDEIDYPYQGTLFNLKIKKTLQFPNYHVLENLENI
jgi:hypothetical protein